MNNRRINISSIITDVNLEPEARDFLESLKSYDYQWLDPHFNERIRVVNGSPEISKIISENTCELGDLNSIPLAELDLSNPTLADYVEWGTRRKSTRIYDPEGLSFETVSQVLQASYFNKNNSTLREGVMTDDEHRALKYKNVASGGGLYAVEAYYVNFRTQGLPAGIYHYNLAKKSLDEIKLLETDESIADVQRAFMADKYRTTNFESATGAIVLAGIINRASFKYSNRAVAFAFIDAGAIIQNLYTISTFMGIGCVGNAGHMDDNLKKHLGLRTVNQVILASVVIGKILTS